MKEFKELSNGTVFCLNGSREVFIKHSNAVSFNLEGKDCIFALNDKVWPKRVSKEIWDKLIEHMNTHENTVKV